MKPYLALCAAAIAAALLFAWKEGSAAHLAESRVQALLQQKAELAGERENVEKENAARVQAQNEARARAKRRAEWEATRGANREALRNVTQLVDNDPELQLLKHKALRTTTALRYGAWFRELHPGAERVQALQAALESYAIDSDDLRAAARSQGLKWGDPAIRNQLKQLDQKLAEAIRGQLGEEGVASFNQYRRSGDVRELMGNVAGAAAANGAPLSLQQVETLSRLACDSAEAYRNGGNANPLDVDWEVVDAQARVLLTPEQFAAFSSFEPIGPSGSGGRHFYLLHATIDKAWAADKAAKANAAPGS